MCCSILVNNFSTVNLMYMVSWIDPINHNMSSYVAANWAPKANVGLHVTFFQTWTMVVLPGCRLSSFKNVSWWLKLDGQDTRQSAFGVEIRAESSFGFPDHGKYHASPVHWVGENQYKKSHFGEIRKHKCLVWSLKSREPNNILSAVSRTQNLQKWHHQTAAGRQRTLPFPVVTPGMEPGCWI